MVDSIDKKSHLGKLGMSEEKLSVRLSAREIEIIRTTVLSLFAQAGLEPAPTIRVFGSRARTDEKGGDIDLLIETAQTLPDRVKSACRLTSALQMQLGDQKIDVILVDPATREQSIHQVARQTGVLL